MGSEDTQFQPGNKLALGRQKGSRNKLSHSFLKALNKTFMEKNEDGKKAGIESLRKLMEKQPAQFHNIIAKLMPKLLELSGPDGGPIDLNWITETVHPPLRPGMVCPNCKKQFEKGQSDITGEPD